MIIKKKLSNYLDKFKPEKKFRKGSLKFKVGYCSKIKLYKAKPPIMYWAIDVCYCEDIERWIDGIIIYDYYPNSYTTEIKFL